MGPGLQGYVAGARRPRDAGAAGQAQAPGQPVLDWCVANAIAVTDPAGGRKLDKAKSTGRIDALQALAMAVGLAARTTPKKPSVYRSRGVLSVDLAAG
jgi:phage terminase large subunit-like protein